MKDTAGMSTIEERMTDVERRVEALEGGFRVGSIYDAPKVEFGDFDLVVRMTGPDRYSITSPQFPELRLGTGNGMAGLQGALRDVPAVLRAIKTVGLAR